MTDLGPRARSARPADRPQASPATGPFALAGAGATAVIVAGLTVSAAARPPGEAARPREREIAVEVRYPERNRLIVPDSNFLFGSIGTPTGSLSIDGEPVDVASNGAFLAWLPEKGKPRPLLGEVAVES